MNWLRRLNPLVPLVACLTLGLAPFNPPHVVDKLGMLVDGELTRLIDIGDLLLHGAPWLVMAAWLGVWVHDRVRGQSETP